MRSRPPPLPRPPSSEYLGSFGSPGNIDGQFLAVSSATIGSNGQIYVSDSTRNRVTTFSYTGSLLGDFGAPGAGNGQFSSPRGVTASDGGSSVYVVDGGNSRVQQFTLAGTVRRRHEQQPHPEVLARRRLRPAMGATGTFQLAADTGTLLTSLTGGAHPTVQAYSPFGEIGATTSPTASDLSRVGGFARAQRDGGFWVAVGDTQGRTLRRRYTANTDIAAEIPLTTAPVTVDSSSSAPSLASDCRGTVLVIDRTAQRVLRFGDPAAPPPPCSTPSSATSAASPSFGTQRISTIGAPQTISLVATGNGIDVSRVRVTGPDADAFLVSRDGRTDKTAWPGTPCGVSVRFAPTAVADASATLEIRDATSR